VQLFGDVVEDYQSFAEYCDDSPCFREWALGVVGDREVQEWIATLPPIKQQPNLVFAAARWHGVPAPGPYDGLRTALLADDGTIRATILARATQTNEVGRLATLLPAFSQVSGGEPVALVEAGASAGLCLYPDGYDYRWTDADGQVTALTGSGGPVLPCATRGPVPFPSAYPTVAYRGGIDLNPLDPTDPDDAGWLAQLVWPEQDDRRTRLELAVAIARRDPPDLVRGDLLELLPRVVADAGRHGRPVVFHSAVIAYLEPSDRVRFEELMNGLVADGVCHWVSNEGKGVLPEVTATGPLATEDLHTFVLGVDGRAVAWTHGHGASMTWL
jgi:hypothetical protein